MDSEKIYRIISPRNKNNLPDEFVPTNKAGTHSNIKSRYVIKKPQPVP